MLFMCGMIGATLCAFCATVPVQRERPERKVPNVGQALTIVSIFAHNLPIEVKNARRGICYGGGGACSRDGGARSF